MRPMLVFDGRAAGTTAARVYTLSPYGYSQLGNDLGTQELALSANNRSFHRGRVVQHQDTVYVLHQRTIKRLNSNGTWSNILTLPNYYTDTGRAGDEQMIMHLCNVGGTYYLAVMYNSSSTVIDTTGYMMALSYNLSTNTYSATSTTALSLSSGGSASNPRNWAFGESVFFNGVIYVPHYGTAYGIVAYNVASVTLSLLDNAIAIGSPTTAPTASLCIWNNELWLAHYDDGTVALQLRKLVGSSFVSQIASVTGGTVAWSTGVSKPCCWTDGTYLYIFALRATGAWDLWQINSSLVATNITSTVISGFTGQDLDSRWRCVVDQHTNPTNPDIYLLYFGDATAGGTIAFYKWNGPSSQMSYLGNAGSAWSVMHIANPMLGGGEMMYSLGEPHIVIEGSPSNTSTPGNCRISYRIYESSLFPSGTPAEVNMYFHPDLGPPTSRCLLTNPSVGTMANNYTITGVTAGSGTLYTVDWRAAANGVNNGDGVTLVASVSGIL